MNPPPKEIDGARLLCFAVVADPVKPTGATTHRAGDKVLGPARALAICQYPEESFYYLFYCDEEWAIRTDTFHLSLDDAKRQAEFEYAGIASQWAAGP